MTNAQYIVVFSDTECHYPVTSEPLPRVGDTIEYSHGDEGSDCTDVYVVKQVVLSLHPRGDTRLTQLQLPTVHAEFVRRIGDEDEDETPG